MSMSKAKLLSGLAISAAMVISAPAVYAATTTVVETGSSLLYPLFNIWVPVYTKANPGVRINTSATGSGTGIAQATQGIVQFGASDAYLSDALMKKYPGMLNIPVAISSQMVNYNVPGENDKHLKFSGPVLADIYEGKIEYWDNAKLKSLNPGAKLPHKAIVPIHRADGSGDSFLFTQFLSKSDSQWSKTISYGTTVSWPAVPGGIGATGNDGMVTALINNPYSVAYVGISYHQKIQNGKLGEARLENRAGHFVMIDKDSVPTAAAAMVPKTPEDGRVSMIFAPGKDSYPIINYEYVIVRAKQPSAHMAAAIKKFLNWAVDDKGGNSLKYLDQVHFLPLPAPARKLTEAQIDQIHG